jgi:hypothetical protein
MIVAMGLRPLIVVTLSPVSPSPSLRGRGNIKRGALPLLYTLLRVGRIKGELKRGRIIKKGSLRGASPLSLKTFPLSFEGEGD